MYRTIVARLPDYALQRRAMPHIGTSMAAPLEIDSRRGNRPQHSDPHRHTGAGPPHRATAGSPRTLEPPPQAHPARRIGPISLIAPPLSCPWGPETKSAQTATFLRREKLPQRAEPPQRAERNRPNLQIQFHRNGAMVRAHDLGINVGHLHLFTQRFAHQKVIDAPPCVIGAGMETVAPPGISAFGCGV